jgi:hypothetical protein
MGANGPLDIAAKSRKPGSDTRENIGGLNQNLQPSSGVYPRARPSPPSVACPPSIREMEKEIVSATGAVWTTGKSRFAEM